MAREQNRLKNVKCRQAMERQGDVMGVDIKLGDAEKFLSREVFTKN